MGGAPDSEYLLCHCVLLGCELGLPWARTRGGVSDKPILLLRGHGSVEFEMSFTFSDLVEIRRKIDRLKSSDSDMELIQIERNEQTLRQVEEIISPWPLTGADGCSTMWGLPVVVDNSRSDYEIAIVGKARDVRLG